MSYTVGTVKNGNLFVRCPHCGDSERRQYVAHLSVSIERGVYYCFRCSAKGKLAANEYISLLTQHDIEHSVLSSTLNDERDYSVSYTDIRYSLLERHTDSYGNVTIAMKDVHGNVTGYQHRTPDKRIQTEGVKGYGYVGSNLVNTDYIRVVEGPYDVVYDNDVCVFGSLSYSMVQRLKLYALLLAPDSDVIRQRNKLKSFVRMVDKLVYAGYTIRGIEIFETGYDPGRAYEENRERNIISTAEFICTAKQKLQSNANNQKAISCSTLY